MPRLLIVEDDFPIANNLFTYFERRGFDVEMVHNGQSALHRCSVERFDIVLLDIGLPGVDGLSFLQRLRTELRVSTPVLAISARTGLEDKLAGFEHGVDDYVTKPFALAEVEARVRALLGRAGGRSPVDPVLKLGSLTFDSVERETRVGSQSVRLGPKASHLLELLMQKPGQLQRRGYLEQALWNSAPAHPDSLRNQVHALRRALALAGFEGIETVHAVGYRIVKRDV